jgi:hypothetical protein
VFDMTNADDLTKSRKEQYHVLGINLGPRINPNKEEEEKGGEGGGE